MTKNTPLTEMSTEELIKNQKTMGTATAALAGLLASLFILSVYKWITKGFTSLIVVPLALLPIVFVNLKKLKEIKEELEIRDKDVTK
ncbi:redox-active disulfide protein 2 [Sphingobacterium gobiense]|uniref:Redox-active disulfide protein 2 n=1 Tax=Sphingobacterium gobiense TaxID=1382456 RepID=A0A2S9JU69_9SPHI|nr:redox-active disulfide protein 2 [Sphingobacterium gobiense]PRD56804.1 redox-active disulfide protein 2 [Sphingobacterium gobiense]